MRVAALYQKKLLLPWDMIVEVSLDVTGQVTV
jgi:hypothetical protein